MERSQIAECVLSVVLPADRAAAVTGDFLEEAGERGGFWFWSSVVRTVASGVWMDILEAPGELIWLGVRGGLANFVSTFLYILLFASLTWPVFLLIKWQGILLIGLLPVWVAFRRSGRWLARRAPDRKLAACVVFFIVDQLIQIATVVVPRFWGIRGGMQFSWLEPFLWVGLVYGALKGDGRKPVAQG